MWQECPHLTIWKGLVEIIFVVWSMGKVFLRGKKREKERDSSTMKLPQSKATQREKLSVQVETAAWCLVDGPHSTSARQLRAWVSDSLFAGFSVLHARLRNKHARKGLSPEELRRTHKTWWILHPSSVMSLWLQDGRRCSLLWARLALVRLHLGLHASLFPTTQGSCLIF